MSDSNAGDMHRFTNAGSWYAFTTGRDVRSSRVGPARVEAGSWLTPRAETDLVSQTIQHATGHRFLWDYDAWSTDPESASKPDGVDVLRLRWTSSTVPRCPAVWADFQNASARFGRPGTFAIFSDFRTVRRIPGASQYIHGRSLVVLAWGHYSEYFRDPNGILELAESRYVGVVKGLELGAFPSSPPPPQRQSAVRNQPD